MWKGDPMTSYHLDRSNPTPLHHQLASAIEDAIHEGRLAAGARIQNEVELSAALGVARQTVRRAMDSLVRRGLLVRRPGYGTHVVETVGQQPKWSSSLRADYEYRIERHSTTIVLVNELTTAPEAKTTALRIRPGEKVLHLWRLRLQNGEPLAILENYLPSNLGHVGDHDLTRVSLYTAIERTGVRPRVATERISARLGTDEECRLLDEPVQTVLLTRQRTTYDDTGRPIDSGAHAIRSSRTSYEMTLVGGRAGFGGVEQHGSHRLSAGNPVQRQQQGAAGGRGQLRVDGVERDGGVIRVDGHPQADERGHRGGQVVE
jgi:DNA-binding GntR family transcriptional regulator